MEYFSEKTIYLIFYFFKKKTKLFTSWPTTPMGARQAHVWSWGWPVPPLILIGGGRGPPGLALGWPWPPPALGGWPTTH